MLSFYEPVQSDFNAVDQLIIEQLHSDVGLVENIGHYLVEAGGKRLRPLLALLASGALEYEGTDHLKLAAIIEFIHTATLLHDDVVDVSELRRGRLTANAKWGNAPSVLVGDFLYSRAFQLMVGIGNMEVMNILADTTNIISEGEVQQLVNARNPDLGEAAYFDVIYKKTAILFASAAETAAVLAGGTPGQRKALRNYGYHLGMAFQLMDDLLDYSGDSKSLGKNVGDDLAEGKPTLPLIVAMQNAPEAEAKIVADALRDGSAEQLDAIVRIVRDNGGLDYTSDRARQHVGNASLELDVMTDSVHLKAMRDLAEFAIDRSF
ncbi:polyprenyl synthetase family protein [Gilvimarinus sp. F26214L]|uniref:polyprenyl synthetase family protein n=1 Tax=Gilvimarinus sp. DZF01 TaxID=3461371 RepID=UPI00404634E4